MEMKKKKFWYAEHNPFGVRVSYDSVGWQIYRFASKSNRDTFVEENKYSNCNQINAKIRRKNLHKIIKNFDQRCIVIRDSFTDRATGIHVDIIDALY